LRSTGDGDGVEGPRNDARRLIVACHVQQNSAHHMSQEKCPVDHRLSSAPTEGCPVDHKAQSSWLGLFSKSHPTSPPNTSLSSERDVSSIPKASGGNWVYPSESQFFAAMARKNHNPQASDMKSIVPIHNAVNERAWAEVMKWEAGRGGEKCGGVKLVNFKGRPGERSWKARWRTLIGCVRS
jgi:cytochrome c heme-lyase